jgi:hypothetical protein
VVGVSKPRAPLESTRKFPSKMRTFQR